jgi:hypothetical protein
VRSLLDGSPIDSSDREAAKLNAAHRRETGERADGSVRAAMSTRRLIVAALLCGLAILVAFALQVVIA